MGRVRDHERSNSHTGKTHRIPQMVTSGIRWYSKWVAVLLYWLIVRVVGDVGVVGRKNMGTIEQAVKDKNM